MPANRETLMTNPEISPKLPSWIQDHLRRYLATNGEDGHIYDLTAAGGGKVPTLLLTTTGRRSGQPSLLPLIYGEANGAYVIVASKGGDPNHPAWYLNLEADPKVQIRVKDKRMHAVARVAHGQERKDLWDKMVAIYAPYTDYQAKTKREIPVVVLDPVKN
jgi:deazaflavin-dependent oxidoreductase (nitroreductase family)